MDRDKYNSQINIKGRNTLWLRYGDSSLRGISRSLADFGSESHPPKFFLKYLLKIKMNTVQNGELAKEFDYNYNDENEQVMCKLRSNKLIPVILLHGLSGSRTS